MPLREGAEAGRKKEQKKSWWLVSYLADKLVSRALRA